MKLEIFAIGKLKDSGLSHLIIDYQKRIIPIGKKLGFKPLDIIEIDHKKNFPEDILKHYEAEHLLKNCPDCMIALDQKGDNLSSVKFADLLNDYKNKSYEKCRFVIGGAYGLDPSVLQKAHKILSFGECTWPHMFVRLMLTEQIYRAITILDNHPYHK